MAAVVVLSLTATLQWAKATGTTSVAAGAQTVTSLAPPPSTTDRPMGPTTTALGPRPSTTLAPTTTLAPRTTTTLAPTTTTTSVPPGPPTRAFCDAARPLADDLRLVLVSLAEPATLRSLIGSASPRSAVAAEAATGAVRAEAEAVKAVVDDLAVVLERADYQLSRLSPEELARLHSPETLGAIGRLGSTVGRSC
ncbi:MAG: hypothetical protein AB1673_15300 [Actinomycetota bacterium]